MLASLDICALAMNRLVIAGEAGTWEVHIDNTMGGIYKTVAELVTDLSCAELCLLVYELTEMYKEN